jgi:pseudouridine kinase
MAKPVICIGAAFVDELFHATEEMMIATTNDAVVTRTAGGVSRNIAHQLALLDVPVQLISVFGNDSEGDWLKKVCTTAGVGLDASITKDGFSGKYTGILKSDGSLFLGFLTNPSNHLITPEHLEQNKHLLKTAFLLLADANLAIQTISWLLAFSNQTELPLIIEPVAVPRARKLKQANLNGLFLITPNEDELPVICSEKALTIQQQIDELLTRGVRHIWLHNGKQGSSVYSKDKNTQLKAPAIEVIDSNGAGDGSLAGFILGKYLGKKDIDCLKLAHTLSAEILQVNGAVVTHVDQQKLLTFVSKYYPEQ